MRSQLVRLLILTVVSFHVTSFGHACSDFRLIAKDDTVLITHSIEFPLEMQSTIQSSARGRQFTTYGPHGDPSLSWRAKYGYLYVDAFEADIVLDGMNEAGLSFEFLFLPNETEYPALSNSKQSQALPYYQLGAWILSNFKTIDEVKKALTAVSIYEAPLSSTLSSNMVFPLHAAVFEANGKGIVIEFVKGSINIYDHIGVMTNSPTYDLQVTNLRNYLNLSPYTPKAMTIDGISYSASAQGSGSTGLPGDTSPTSRFIRIAFLTTAATQAANKTSLINLAQHIVNNVDIPAGISRTIDNGKEFSDHTQWVTFKDLTNKLFYYRSYEDLALHAIDINKIDFSPAATPIKQEIAPSSSPTEINSAQPVKSITMSPAKTANLHNPVYIPTPIMASTLPTQTMKFIARTVAMPSPTSPITVHIPTMCHRNSPQKQTTPIVTEATNAIKQINIKAVSITSFVSQQISNMMNDIQSKLRTFIKQPKAQLSLRETLAQQTLSTPLSNTEAASIGSSYAYSSCRYLMKASIDTTNLALSEHRIVCKYKSTLIKPTMILHRV